VVLAGSLGMLENQPSEAIIDLEKANAALAAGPAIHTMLSHLAAYDPRVGITLEADLDPTIEPFLKDHAMNGNPILPGVMGIEGFSVAAKHIATRLASEDAEFEVTGLEDIHFLTPFKFYHDEPRKVTWRALPLREASGLVVYVTLKSSLALKVRKMDDLLHFTGKVHLQPLSEVQAAEIQQATPPVWKEGSPEVPSKVIYNLYFHGPSFQVLEGVQYLTDRVVGRLNKNVGRITNQEHPMITAPLLVELCFQTAGIYEIGSSGSLALPSSIGELTIYRGGVNGEPIFAEVIPHEDEDGKLRFEARVVDAKGRLYLELKDYRTSRLPYSLPEEDLEPIRSVMN
jgi:hypothetical protein